MYALRKRLIHAHPYAPIPSPRKEGGQNNVRKLIKYKLQQQTVRFVHFGPPSGPVTLYISFVTKRRRNKKGGNAYEEMKKKEDGRCGRREVQCSRSVTSFGAFFSLYGSELFCSVQRSSCMSSFAFYGWRTVEYWAGWVGLLPVFFVAILHHCMRLCDSFVVVEFFFVRVCLQFFRDAAGQLQCFQISCTLCTDPAAITPLVGGNVNDVT